jgi:hypothetical protein
MNHQMPLMECHQQSRAPLPFFKRIGYLELCVLPDDVLDNTSLPDPETGDAPPSLRQSASADVLCYARVLYACVPGLYRAKVGASPDQVSASPDQVDQDHELITLTEEQLTYAQAWDIRLQNKHPEYIRHILFACAEKDLPTPAPTGHISEEAVNPAPAVSLQATEPIEVSANDLQQMFTPERQTPSRKLSLFLVPRPSVFVLQQRLLSAMLAILKQQISQAREQSEARALQARCTLVTQIQQWHRKTHQRVVHLTLDWSRSYQGEVWHLTLGVPEALLASASQ